MDVPEYHYPKDDSDDGNYSDNSSEECVENVSNLFEGI